MPNKVQWHVCGMLPAKYRDVGLLVALWPLPTASFGAKMANLATKWPKVANIQLKQVRSTPNKVQWDVCDVCLRNCKGWGRLVALWPLPTASFGAKMAILTTWPQILANIQPLYSVETGPFDANQSAMACLWYCAHEIAWDGGSWWHVATSNG